MRILILIIITVFLVSCENKGDNAQTDYSEKFYKTITQSGIELNNDSLLFPAESGIDEPIIIPTILALNEKFVFNSQNDMILKLERKNYTDIEYELSADNIREKGLASLVPTFYVGAESVETSEGGFWVTDYEVENSKFLITIRIGNEGLSDENLTGIYVYTIPRGDCKFDKLVEYEDIWRLAK